MKKLIILIFFVSLSCSKDTNECYCNGKYKIFGSGNYYKKTIVDCETNIPTHNQAQDNAYFVGCE